VIRPASTHTGEQALRQPPAFVIRLAFEERPAVLLEAFSEGDEDRLMDWVVANDLLLDLITRALELVDEPEAA
jgi:hypothetical protein